MITLKFETIKFKDIGDRILGEFYNLFEFEIPRDKIEEISDFEIRHEGIIFKSKDPSVEDRFYELLIDVLRRDLKSKITGRKATYIDYDFLPLLGTQYFGFYDRGTSIVEVRPLTGCVNQCIFCSVREGPREKFWKRDFIVQREYLADYARELLRLKKESRLEWFINPQGEAVLYPELTELIQGLSQYGKVGLVTTLVDTDVDDVLDWIDAGLSYLNVSLHSIDPKLSKILVGNPDYDVSKVLEIIKSVSGKIDITLTPVIIKRYNYKDLEDIVKFAREFIQNRKRPLVLPQKYLIYRHGRKIVNENFSWKEFYDYLNLLEKKYGVKLTGFSLEDLGIRESILAPSKIKVGKTYSPERIIEGRRKGEYIVKIKDRSVSVYSSTSVFDRVKIVYAKDNIFIGEAV